MCCLCLSNDGCSSALRRNIVILYLPTNINIQHFNLHQSSIHPLSYFPGILTSYKIAIPNEIIIGASKSQSRKFVAASLPTLLKAATGSSVHSETSGASQLIHNDPKQVKDTTERFNSKYNKPTIKH